MSPSLRPRPGPRHVLADPPNSGGVHAVAGQGALFEEVLAAPAFGEVVHGLKEARPYLGRIAVTDGLDEQLAERPLLEQLPEDVEDAAAQGRALLLDLLEQALEDVALAGLLGDEVPEVADLGLADAVDAPEALLGRLDPRLGAASQQLFFGEALSSRSRRRLRDW